MKTIIAPVDYSAISNNAAIYAAQMAAYLQAELILFHVQELPASVTEFPVSEGIVNSRMGEAEMEDLKKTLIAATDNKIQIECAYVLGSVEYEIGELSRRKNPIMIVMGTHSYGAVERFLLGSKTFHTARHARHPVLIVPPTAEFKPFKKIGLASDLKNVYEVPVNEIEMIVKYFNAGLDIFYAGKDEREFSKRTIGDMLLEGRLERLNPQFHFIHDQDVMHGVSNLAEKNNTDLLIVIPRKHGIFHQSQSKDFILYSNVPVLAIHENDSVPAK